MDCKWEGLKVIDFCKENSGVEQSLANWLDAQSGVLARPITSRSHGSNPAPAIFNMTGAGEGKKLLGKANVYVHEKGKSGAMVTHIDIELDELNEIIKPGENSFVGAKRGGVFIGLKKEMIERAEKVLGKEK